MISRLIVLYDNVRRVHRAVLIHVYFRRALVLHKYGVPILFILYLLLLIFNIEIISKMFQNLWSNHNNLIIMLPTDDCHIGVFNDGGEVRSIR